jgi:TetR/AcrR family transcriptional regulator, transcriptional repressor for nem operon
MRNPEITKKKIIQTSAGLFNTMGYKATSLSDITDATHLTKGAIYRHFRNKEDLEQASLAYMSDIVVSTLRDRIKGSRTAPEKLKTICYFFKSYISHPPISGGCPLLNAAIEADDVHPELRNQALNILNILTNSLIYILEKGKKFGQIRPNIDSAQYACIFIASLEGAIMMSKLRKASTDMDHIIAYLENIIHEIQTKPAN